MYFVPKQATLPELIYREIGKNDYLLEIYSSLLYNYATELFGLERPLKPINKRDALRFADLLSKSTYEPTKERDHQWGQEIATLLRLIYPEDEVVKYYLGSVLSAVGNYRGLKSQTTLGYQNADIFDCLFYEFDKEKHRIPGLTDEYFFREQKSVFDGLSSQFFSYSGPTSMGKSFVVQTYIKQQIANGSCANYAILVPTKALINEVRKSFFDDLQEKLYESNYRIVSAIGEIYLQQKHHFIFIMTPERMHHLLIEQKDVDVDFLFVDEAHKISERGERSTYYYKVLSQIKHLSHIPTVIFASPNIPNPEVYLRLIPGIDSNQIRKLTSKYTPVSQFKFYVDVPNRNIFVHDEHSKRFEQICRISSETSLTRIVLRLGRTKQNVVYCSSRQKVIEYAMDYSHEIQILNNPCLKKLANDIRNEVHKECYLADLVEKGIAYHVGYLPTNIRMRIEQSFEDGDLRTIFCTSTLVEGVNLPADNLFITSYKNGTSNMNEVEFKNLVGRVGRIKYNLYGNVFLLRLDNSHTERQYTELLENEVPNQKLSIDLIENKTHIPVMIDDLVKGDIELKQCHEQTKEKDFEALRKFALILINDYAKGENTPITQMFEEYVDERKKNGIKTNFPEEKTNEDITLSFDQSANLKKVIERGYEYPKLIGNTDEVDFEEVVSFLKLLSRVYRWDIYEKETIGKSGEVLRWYANILLRWIRGNGLRAIIDSAITFKEKNPEDGIWVGNRKIVERYNKNSQLHKNYVIAETLGVIENVLLFSISNYFRQFSIEYKRFHGIDHFENDWYEYVEYGTTNEITRFLQRVGFSRESATYLELPRNKEKFIVEQEDGVRLRQSVFVCGNASVEFDSKEISYNMPELFIE